MYKVNRQTCEVFKTSQVYTHADVLSNYINLISGKNLKYF
jgi:hypothetical protein